MNIDIPLRFKILHNIYVLSKVVILLLFFKFHENNKETIKADIMINRQRNDKANYEAPVVEIIEVEVEQGFALSGGDNEPLGGRYDDFGW